MAKVLLCIPPDYDHNFPPLGTPALAAFLKHNGVAVGQKDLNLDYRRFLIKRIGHCALTDAQKKIFLPVILKKFFYKNLRNRYYSKYLQRAKVPGLPLLPYDNNTNSSFYFTERLLNSLHLKRYLSDEKENTFLQYYQAGSLIDECKKGHVFLLGLSVTSPSQVIPSLTLGYWMKKNMPDIHIILGGQWVSLYRRQILARKDLFSYFDSFIPFEGETALARLAKAVARGDSSPIPQVIRKNSLPSNLDHFVPEDMDQLPCPDFDDLPLCDYDEYTESGPDLTYETSRGCYWSRCAYCVDLPLPKPAYRRKSANLVAQDIKQLKKKYNVQSLMLGDPGMAPRQMLEVSKAIIENNIKIHWWCMARLDEGFRRPVFEKARRAGLWQVNFGFESASDRLCDLLDKGNRRDRSSRVIKDAHAAGIGVDLQTIVGLPQETLSDGLETVDFLVKHRAYINHVSFNIFYLTPENFVFKNPKKYGLGIDKRKILPFGFFLPFKNKKGMSASEAYLLQKLYLSFIENKSSPGNGAVLDEDRALALAQGVREGVLTLMLNDEEAEVCFLKNQKTGDVILHDDVYHDLFVRLGKGICFRKIKQGWIRRYGRDVAKVHEAFAAEALAKGFLRYV